MQQFLHKKLFVFAISELICLISVIIQLVFKFSVHFKGWTMQVGNCVA